MTGASSKYEKMYEMWFIKFPTENISQKACSASFPRASHFWSQSWTPFRVRWRSIVTSACDLILVEAEGKRQFLVGRISEFLKTIPSKKGFVVKLPECLKNSWRKSDRCNTHWGGLIHCSHCSKCLGSCREHNWLKSLPSWSILSYRGNGQYSISNKLSSVSEGTKSIAKN